MFRVLILLPDQEEFLSGRHPIDLHITAYLLIPQLQLSGRRPFQNKVLVKCFLSIAGRYTQVMRVLNVDFWL